MSLDLIAGVLAGLVSLCVFTLHVVSSPARRPWMNMPPIVRWGLLAMGTTMMMRSVNILSFVGNPTVHVGQGNAWAVFSWTGMCAGILPLTWWIAGLKLPDRAWERLEWARGVLKHQPDDVPIIVPAGSVVDIARATGFVVNAEGSMPLPDSMAPPIKATAGKGRAT